MDIKDVTGATIERAQFKDKVFEQFVQRLLKFERDARHRPDADIEGPAADYHGDDQRDLMFVVRGAPQKPRTQFADALTWDEIKTTWYSCKGGGSWRESILRDLGRAARNTSIKNEAAPSEHVKKRPPPKLLEHVEGGGRYAFTVAVQASDDGGLLDKASELLKFWLEHDKRDVPDDLRGQLAFIDANRLANFISTHSPELSKEHREALGLTQPEGLKGWGQWSAELAVGRDHPRFEEDAVRAQLLAAIADVQRRVLRVFGPPGVGKTRLVLEGIRRCGSEAQDRTRYSDRVEVSLRAVQDSWLRDGAKPWLVLDELRSVDVDQAKRFFEANAVDGARLILIGTSDGEAIAKPGEAFALPELGEEQTRRLIAKEAASLSDAQLDAIWMLSEGYPWYAVLLARAVRPGDPTLEHGDDDATRWYSGTLRVLAGNMSDYSDEGRWRDEAELRAKALLVAMLTRDIELEWGELCERHGDALRLAIDEPQRWDEVVRRGPICRDRQLLRQTGLAATRRYVSPNNLARLILHHFLTDPDLGPKIRRYAPQFRSTLVAIAKAVRVKPLLLERLARGEFDELERRAREEGLEAVDEYVRNAEPVYGAARDVPEHAATTMASVVLRASQDALRQGANLRPVAAFVFEHVIHRKITAKAFLAVEAALIAIARVDDSSFANNAAGIWKSLFLPGLHNTHQDWTLRRGQLDARLGEQDAFVRTLAIEALARAVAPRERGLGYSEQDKRDGEWPSLTIGEFKARKAELWTRLLNVCDDPQREFAEIGQTAVAERIRGGVGRGLEPSALARIGDQLDTWSPEPKRKLAESLADIRRYDLHEYEEREYLDALTSLERAATPSQLAERVRAQIGTWRPGPWQINDPQRREHELAGDLELAHALLSDEEALEWALGWSTTSQAHRGSALWFALGRADSDRRLLEGTSSAAQLDVEFPGTCLGQYLLGWADADDASTVEAWLFATTLQGNHPLCEAAQWFLVFQTPTPQRLDRVRELVGFGAVVPQALVVLAFRGWERLDGTAVLEFLRAIADADELTELRLRLGIAQLGRELSAQHRETVLEQLQIAVDQALEQRVVAGTQSVVVEGCLALADAGKLDFVSSQVLRALALYDGANVRLAHDLLEALFKAGHAQALWPTFANALFDDDPPTLRWELDFANVRAHVPHARVIEWVDDDLRRALSIVSLANPHAERLDPLVHELLVRFGPDGPIGERLHVRALTTPGVVAGGLEAWRRTQRDHAKAWQRGAPPAVATWARRLESELNERIGEDDARAELRAKYG